MSEQGGNNAQNLQRLLPPTFALPDNTRVNDDDDYEVWTVRIPTDLNVESLEGIELDVTTINASSSLPLATFRTTEEGSSIEYDVTDGTASENEMFRLLLRNDEDNDDDATFLRPHGRPFDRHVNVVTTAATSIGQQRLDDTLLAPRLEKAPTPVDPIRRSYSHVPQASGLKRRWMPPGTRSVVSSTTAAVASNSKIPETPPGRRINGIKHEEHGSLGMQESPALLSTPVHSNGTSMSSTGTASTNGNVCSESKRLKVQENGDHHSTPMDKMSKKERKKAKKAKKERKRAKKEQQGIKSEDT